MSNTPQDPSRLAASIGSSLLITVGLVALLLAANLNVEATLLPTTGKGAVVPAATQAATLLQDDSLHAAAEAPNRAGLTLVLGMFFILAGLSIHALLVLRHERPITASSLPHRPISAHDLDVTRVLIELYEKEQWR